MSHCVHFLSRLERVSMVHADFALELYRNPGLVRTLMEEFSAVYDGEARAALALGENGAGPYVVIAVDGGFVTCLGEKMKPRGLKVIKRELLESRRIFSEELSVAVKQFNQLSKKGGTTRLFRRIIGNGQLVCREDVEQIVAVLPALQMNLIEHVVSMSSLTMKERGKLMRVIREHRNLRGRRADKTKRLIAKAAATYWTSIWSIATCHAIVAAGGEHSLMSMYFMDGDELGPVHAVSWLEGHTGLALRSLWGAGMRGVAVVGFYEGGLHELTDSEDVIGNIASLTIAALRHPELRTRVKKHLRAIEREHGIYPRVEYALLCAHDVLDEDVEGSYAVQRLLGQEVYGIVRRSLSPNHPDYYEDVEDVPEPLLRTLSIMLPDYFHQHLEPLFAMFVCLPWLAQASLGDLFLPRRLNNTLLAVGPKHAEKGMQLLTWQTFDEKRPLPFVEKEQVAGRNDPCPCQSGRKYKQCCLNRASDSEPNIMSSTLELLSPS